VAGAAGGGDRAAGRCKLTRLAQALPSVPNNRSTTPEIGEAKKGDLTGDFVYKFKCVGQLALLADEFDPATRLLLLLGSHENFYRELKR
jgi:hypothetical protein